MNVELNPPQEAPLVLLHADGGRTALTAQILSMQGRQMSIGCDTAIDVGASIELRWSHYLVLAEVANSDSRKYSLKIRHLFDLTVVEPLRQKWV
jgi:hypothetical protein